MVQATLTHPPDAHTQDDSSRTRDHAPAVCSNDSVVATQDLTLLKARMFLLTVVGLLSVALWGIGKYQTHLIFTI